MRQKIKRGFICRATIDGKCSYKEHIASVRLIHELNKEELTHIMSKAPKLPYAKCFGKWIPLTSEQAESMKNDLVIEWR